MYEKNAYLIWMAWRRELLSLVVLFSLFLFVNVATSMLYPGVWDDEVGWMDPGVNLYLGNGWTSTATPYQHRHEFWAGYPVYPLTVWLWIEAFGFSPVVVRSLNYFLTLISVGLIWLSVVRLKLVPSAVGRVALCATLLLSYGISFCYRGGRIDCVLMLLAAASLLAFTIHSVRLRCGVLAVLGFLYPLAGLHMAFYAAVLTLILLAYLGRRFFKEFLSINVGVALGLVGFSTLLWMNGVLDAFVPKVSYQTSTGLLGSIITGTFTHNRILNKLPKDPSLLLLLLALAVMSYRRIREHRMGCRSVGSFAIVLSVVVPTLFVIVAKFPTYYTWMIIIPLSICIVSLLSGGELSRGERSLGWSFIMLAGLLGTPFQLLVASYDAQDRDYSKVEALVTNNVTGDDWVYTEFAGYYPAKRSAEVVFLPYYLKVMSPEEKKRISVLIVNPTNVEHVIAAIGGQWRREVDGVHPTKKSLWERIFGQPRGQGLLDYKYHLLVWKRVM